MADSQKQGGMPSTDDAKDKAREFASQAKQQADQLGQKAKDSYGEARESGHERLSPGRRLDRPEPRPRDADGLRRWVWSRHRALHRS